jgi:hypothetical protein
MLHKYKSTVARSKSPQSHRGNESGVRRFTPERKKAVFLALFPGLASRLYPLLRLIGPSNRSDTTPSKARFRSWIQRPHQTTQRRRQCGQVKVQTVHHLSVVRAPSPSLRFIRRANSSMIKMGTGQCRTDSHRHHGALPSDLSPTCTLNSWMPSHARCSLLRPGLSALLTDPNGASIRNVRDGPSPRRGLRIRNHAYSAKSPERAPDRMR